MDYEQELRRQWEVNVYNDLGFICNGYQIEETDHGYKNEKREATDIEESLWRKFYHKTPKIPVVQMPDDIDLTLISELPLDVEAQALEGEYIWVQNVYDIVLLQKDGTRWRERFSEILRIREY